MSSEVYLGPYLKVRVGKTTERRNTNGCTKCDNTTWGLQPFCERCGAPMTNEVRDVPCNDSPSSFMYANFRPMKVSQHDVDIEGWEYFTASYGCYNATEWNGTQNAVTDLPDKDAERRIAEFEKAVEPMMVALYERFGADGVVIGYGLLVSLTNGDD